jgi:hypothetical protein
MRYRVDPSRTHATSPALPAIRSAIRRAQNRWITGLADLMSKNCVYLANPRARAALTYFECGACRDWTR